MSTLLETERSPNRSTNRGGSSSGINDLTATGQVDGAWSTSPLQLPNLTSRAAYAASTKAAARLNATTITSKEHDDFLSERQSLLDKLFTDTITQEEKNRLQYVRWSLDKIEDAKHGAALDALEVQADAYENLLSELQNFYGHLNNRVASRKR